MIDNSTLQMITISLNILFILWLIFVDRRSYRFLVFWILFFVALPYVSWVAYFLYHIMFDFSVGRFGENYQEIIDTCDEIINPLVEKISHNRIVERYRKIIDVNCFSNGFDVTGRNSLLFFYEVNDYYQNLFSQIENAKKYVYLEMYIIENDHVGNELFSLLCKKRKEGLKIIVIFDQCGSRKLKKEFYQKLVSLGGIVLPFFKNGIKGKLVNFNFRNHRKLVIVDGIYAYIGGANIGDEYLSNNPKITPWKDSQVQVKGETVLLLLKQFYADYNFALFQKHGFFHLHLDSEDFVCNQEENFLPIQVISSSLNHSKERIVSSFLALLGEAKKTIRIQTPYFVPNEEVMASLKLCIEGGVEVLLMIPQVYDQRIPYRVTMHYAAILLGWGARVYRYKGFIHSKTIVIDDDILMIGSSNMDIRSLRYNYETNICFYSKIEAKKYIDYINLDLKKSKELHKQDLAYQSLVNKIEQKIYLLFSQIM